MTFKKMLTVAGIPSVIYSAESVFTSDEAQELRRLMMGIIHYENEGYLLGALTTALFSIRAADIAACSENDDQMERWRTKFKNYSDLWQTKGFLTMFIVLLEREGARPRIASYPDGERRLTNFTHLAQQLFQAQACGNSRPSDLLKWLDDMTVAEDSAQDDQQLRLETDSHCIRIVTIHKSKGLEYPIVFCPFAWETGPGQNKALPLCFHDENNNWQATADLGTEDMEASTVLYERESLAENCRLLYVALTRAKNRCYFVWGNIRGTQSSALTYLFHRNFWMNNTLSLTNEEMIEQMTSIANIAHHDIKISHLEEAPIVEKWLPQKETGKIIYQEFQGRIDQHWKIASYTYLTKAYQDDSEWDEETAITSRPAVIPEGDDVRNFLAFPPGPKSGILLHEILEKLDFNSVREEQTKTLVIDVLCKHDYPAEWQKGVLNMLDELVHAGLDFSGRHDFSLFRIGTAHCVKEMEFYFPLRDIYPARLMSVLERSEHGREREEQKKLHFPPVRGFLKGFIDLVFEYNGQYYLADWKSNDLGNCYECYTPELLKKEIIKSFYDVQYLIYSVALHQYLKKRLPGYVYEKHFGGVYYFFLRGINAKAGKTNGIYFNRPTESFIKQMEKALLAAS